MRLARPAIARTAGRIGLSAALICGSILVSRSYLLLNVELSRRLSTVGWKAIPLVLCFVVAACIGLMHVPESSAKRHTLIGIAVLVWLGGVCLSGRIAGNPSAFFWGALVPYLLAATTFVSISAVRPTLSEAAHIITLAALVMAASVILDAEGCWFAYDPLRRPHGLAYSRNYAGEYIALSLPFCLPVLSRPGRRWLIPILGFALALTRCRTAWIVSAVGAGWVVIFAVASRRKDLLVGMGLCVAAVLSAGFVPTKLHWMEKQPYRATFSRALELQSGSGALRLRQYQETAALLKGRLLSGLGPGAWRDEMGRRDAMLAINWNPHSDYLRAVADGGLLGLCGLVTLFVLGAGYAWCLRFHAAFAFLVELAITSLADAPLYRIETLTLAFVVLAIIADGSFATQSEKIPSAQAASSASPPLTPAPR